MDILSFTPYYTGSGHNGGAETTLHDVMRYFRNSGHRTTALTSRPFPNQDGFSGYVLDGVMVQGYSSKLDIDAYVPSFDLVVSHLGDAARASMKATQYGKTSVQLIHNDQEYCVKYAKYADGLIFNTAWVAEAYSGVDALTTILHPPVEPKRYSVETTREYITLVNLTVGTTERLSYDKGAHTFYELARRFPNERFLAVQGGYGDQFIPHDLPPNVSILGHTDNINSVYRVSKVMLLPSKYESYGRVPLEAACSGIPSVVTDTEGTSEGIGDAARRCQFGNLDEWEHSLQEVLDNYDDYSYRAARRAALCWRRSLEEFERLDEFLEMLEVING